jgi:hypothetical protein
LLDGLWLIARGLIGTGKLKLGCHGLSVNALPPRHKEHGENTAQDSRKTGINTKLENLRG